MPTALTPVATTGSVPTAPRSSPLPFHIKASPEKFTSAFNASLASVQSAIASGMSLPPSAISAHDHLPRAGAHPHAPPVQADASRIPPALAETWSTMRRAFSHFVDWLAGRSEVGSLDVSFPTHANGQPIIGVIATCSAGDDGPDDDHYLVRVCLIVQTGPPHDFLTAIKAVRLLRLPPEKVAYLIASRLLLALHGAPTE